MKFIISFFFKLKKVGTKEEVIKSERISKQRVKNRFGDIIFEWTMKTTPEKRQKRNKT